MLQLSDFHKNYSFKQLATLLALIAILFQAILIIYNSATGFYDIDNVFSFLTHLFFSSLLTFVASLIMTFPDIAIVKWFDHFMEWKSDIAIFRILLQGISALILGIFIGLSITFISHVIAPYQEDVYQIMLNNARSFAIANLILMTTLEAFVFFTQSKESEKQREQLEGELKSIQFELLKRQIDPHFMFNSLNVLSGLIDTDSEKAQLFIDEFSSIYRYVLTTIEKPLVTLREEIEFIESYLMLQQVRYGNTLTTSIAIHDEDLSLQLPPLSLQTPIENAIKHNQLTSDKPLTISITSTQSSIVVENTYQPKQSIRSSTKLGQPQLEKRYHLLNAPKPIFELKGQRYTATLPLLKKI